METREEIAMSELEPCNFCGNPTKGWLVTTPICDPCYDKLAKEANAEIADNEGAPMTEYRIETVKDFLMVPKDRRHACIEGFMDWLEIADDLKALTMPGSPFRYDFIDDGKRDRTVLFETSPERSCNTCQHVTSFGCLPVRNGECGEDHRAWVLAINPQ